MDLNYLCQRHQVSWLMVENATDASAKFIASSVIATPRASPPDFGSPTEA